MDDNFEYTCVVCKEFLGNSNPRQLCGKTYCVNIDNIHDNEDDMFTDIYYEEENILNKESILDKENILDKGNIQENKYLKSDVEIDYCNYDYNEENIKYENKCLICDLDLGESNNRQLCGKTHCTNFFYQ